jgi:hypothetical protein
MIVAFGGGRHRGWDREVLIACCTLIDADWTLIGNKTGPTRPGFAPSLKFFKLEARFPRHAREIPAAVEYGASQVKAEPEMLASYRFSGHTFEYPIERRSAAPSALGKPRVCTKRR